MIRSTGVSVTRFKPKVPATQEPRRVQPSGAQRTTHLVEDGGDAKFGGDDRRAYTTATDLPLGWGFGGQPR